MLEYKYHIAYASQLGQGAVISPGRTVITARAPIDSEDVLPRIEEIIKDNLKSLLNPSMPTSGVWVCILSWQLIRSYEIQEDERPINISELT